MTTWNKISVNQTVRLARAAVRKRADKQTPLPHSTEPVSSFAQFVEKKAFAKKNKTSVVYNTTGEQFPYLKNFENEIDFAFATPSLLAAIYITARSNPSAWHIISAQEDSANYSPTEDVVEKVNAYFKAAGEPLADELHEIHTMVETFLQPDEKNLSFGKSYFCGADLRTSLFATISSQFEDSKIDRTLRTNTEISKSTKTSADAKTYEFIFRNFKQKSLWFVGEKK